MSYTLIYTLIHSYTLDLIHSYTLIYTLIHSYTLDLIHSYTLLYTHIHSQNSEGCPTGRNLLDLVNLSAEK